MILVDTGPFVALFDPGDSEHRRCREAFRGVGDDFSTTVPVLTEAFHMLAPGSRGADNLRSFVLRGGVSVWFMDESSLSRAFELMEKYADLPMDLADASLVTAAEVLGTRRIFTLDFRDFSVYRIRKGRRLESLDVIQIGRDR